MNTGINDTARCAAGSSARAAAVHWGSYGGCGAREEPPMTRIPSYLGVQLQRSRGTLCCSCSQVPCQSYHLYRCLPVELDCDLGRQTRFHVKKISRIHLEKLQTKEFSACSG